MSEALRSRYLDLLSGGRRAVYPASASEFDSGAFARRHDKLTAIEKNVLGNGDLPLALRAPLTRERLGISEADIAAYTPPEMKGGLSLTILEHVGTRARDVLSQLASIQRGFAINTKDIDPQQKWSYRSLARPLIIAAASGIPGLLAFGIALNNAYERFKAVTDSQPVPCGEAITARIAYGFDTQLGRNTGPFSDLADVSGDGGWGVGGRSFITGPGVRVETSKSFKQLYGSTTILRVPNLRNGLGDEVFPVYPDDPYEIDDETLKIGGAYFEAQEAYERLARDVTDQEWGRNSGKEIDGRVTIYNDPEPDTTNRDQWCSASGPNMTVESPSDDTFGKFHKTKVTVPNLIWDRLDSFLEGDQYQK